MTEFKYDVFVSYSSGNKKWVRETFIPILEKEGLVCCDYHKDFEVGAPIVKEMERAILESRKTILVLSPEYLESGWTEFENLMLQTLDAANQKRRLLPVVHKHCKLPLRFSYMNCVNLDNPDDEKIEWQRLFKAIGKPISEDKANQSSRGKIFISYRRADTEGYAGRIYDRLSTYFTNSEIFMDVDNIEPRENFVDALDNAVSSCDVLIALIGRQWLTIEDKQGRRRLENPNDFVRIEIYTALKRGVRVIPLLLGGANMPHSSDLPDNLKVLCELNALEIRHSSFGADIGKVKRAIEKYLNHLRSSENRKTRANNTQVCRKSPATAHCEDGPLYHYKVAYEEAEALLEKLKE